MEKKYTIYKTTNLVNGKIYIGFHSTYYPDDDYLGSGSALKSAIEKYGRENFRKDVLHIFNNKEDMLNKEAELVNEEFILREDTYNIIQGGRSALGYKHTEEHKQKMSEMMSGSRNHRAGTKATEETIHKQRESLRRLYEEYPELRSEKSALQKQRLDSMSEEEKEQVWSKIGSKLRGVEKSEDHKESIRKSKAKRDNSHTEETKAKISKAMKSVKKPPGIYAGCQKGKKKNFKTVQCPHCNLTGSGPAMYKYHMDNCKHIEVS